MSEDWAKAATLSRSARKARNMRVMLSDAKLRLKLSDAPSRVSHSIEFRILASRKREGIHFRSVLREESIPSANRFRPTAVPAAGSLPSRRKSARLPQSRLDHWDYAELRRSPQHVPSLRGKVRRLTFCNLCRKFKR